MLKTIARLPMPSIAPQTARPSNDRFALCGNAVHVWRIPVAASAAQMSEFSHLLTETECQRGSRFVREVDRLRFALGRAATRALLSGYLRRPAAAIGLIADAHGKLRLETAAAADQPVIHFNLSHSGDWVLVAFARVCALGIDVEATAERAASADLIAYVMCDQEQQQLRSLPAPRRRAAFFKCWTSKEALLKGCGVGLSVAPRAIEVAIDPDAPARLIGAPAALHPEAWSLHTLAFPEGYAGTLAVAAAPVDIVDIAVDSWRDLTPASL
jgi:4'-phosphopantetheinyl transferase